MIGSRMCGPAVMVSSLPSDLAIPLPYHHNKKLMTLKQASMMSARCQGPANTAPVSTESTPITETVIESNLLSRGPEAYLAIFL